MTKILDETITIIQQSEGFRSAPYHCFAGVLSIGYGHTDGVKPTDKISRVDATKLLLADIEKIIVQLDSLHFDIDVYQTNALASFIYNIGFTAFKNSKVYAILCNTRGCIARDVAVTNQLKRWKYATRNGKKYILYGLVKRRNKEVELFLKREYN